MRLKPKSTSAEMMLCCKSNRSHATKRSTGTNFYIKFQAIKVRLDGRGGVVISILGTWYGPHPLKALFEQWAVCSQANLIHLQPQL